VSAVAFSPDGQTILTGTQGDVAQAWDAATGKPRGKVLPHGKRYGYPLGFRSGVTVFLSGVAISPNGKTFLTASTDGTARLWDATTGDPLGEPLYHAEAISAVAFHPDGKTVLTGGANGEVRLWDVATGKPCGEPMRHDEAVLAVAFSADGRTIVAGSRSGAVRRWDLPVVRDEKARVRLWIEVLTGLTWDANNAVQELSSDAWLVRRKPLTKLGGPPLPWQTNAPRTPVIEGRAATMPWGAAAGGVF
jgi:WD40 repeat protein